MDELQQVKYDNQLILTTEQLAEFYETSTSAISDNFKNNESKFEEGKHYYLLKGMQLKEFKSQSENFRLPINKFASQLYLWTKRGASRHAKMLGTDRAWDVYDELEETYFNRQKELRMPETPTEILAVIGKVTQEQDKQIRELDTKVTFLTDLSGLTSARSKELTKARNKKVIQVCGGSDSNAYKDVTLRKKVYQAMFKDYKDRFDVTQYVDTPMKNEVLLGVLGRFITEKIKVAVNEVLDERGGRQPTQMTLNTPQKNKRLNIKETAEYLNTSVATLNRRRKDTPELKALEHSDGKSNYFMSFELDEYLLK